MASLFAQVFTDNTLYTHNKAVPRLPATLLLASL